MNTKEINIRYEEYQSLEELSADDRSLLELANEATKTSYAPYSEFCVGAAILLDNGEIVIGNNQENAAYPSGICAERVAMFTASSQYPGVAMNTIALTAFTNKFEIDFPVSPCGACRQVIAEYETLAGKPIRIILQGNSEKIWIIDGIANLLPLMFHGGDLKK